MKIFRSIVYIMVAARVSNCILNELLVAEYFRTKFLSVGTILTCQGTKEKFLSAKKLMQYNKRINFFDIENYNDFACEKTLLRKYHHLAVILEGQCNNSKNILQKCGKIKLLDDSHHWLIIFENPPDMDDYFGNITLNINSDINVALPNEDGQIWTMLDVYNPASEHGGQLHVNKIGYFRRDGGYQISQNGSKYWARKNFTGVTFKSAVVMPKESRDISLHEYLTSDDNREKNSMHRFQSITVQHCRDLYNFRLLVARTDSWGYIQNGSTFNGLVGLLQRKLIDFGSSPLIYKYDRMPVIDYSFGNWILKSTFIFRPPASSASSFEIFTRPLERNVWLSMFVSSLLIAVFAKLILLTEKLRPSRIRKSVDSTWSFIVVFICGAFCQQGSLYNPVLTSGRILTLFLFILSLIIYQFYSGYIVSYLLMEPPREINNLEELLHSSLDAGIENILIDKNYFIQTTDPIAIKLFHEKIQKRDFDGFYEPDVGLEMVLKHPFAFHVETSTAYPIIKKTFPPRIACTLEEVQMYKTQPMHTNLQKHSPFREMLNYCMLRLVENGNMFWLRNHWDSHRPECLPGDYSATITVGINEFSCALSILCFGIGVSCCLLVAEIVLNKYKLKKFHKRTIKIRQIKSRY